MNELINSLMALKIDDQVIGLAYSQWEGWRVQVKDPTLILMQGDNSCHQDENGGKHYKASYRGVTLVCYIMPQEAAA